MVYSVGFQPHLLATSYVLLQNKLLVLLYIRFFHIVLKSLHAHAQTHTHTYAKTYYYTHTIKNACLDSASLLSYRNQSVEDFQLKRSERFLVDEKIDHHFSFSCCELFDMIFLHYADKCHKKTS